MDLHKDVEVSYIIVSYLAYKLFAELTWLD